MPVVIAETATIVMIMIIELIETFVDNEIFRFFIKAPVVADYFFYNNILYTHLVFLWRQKKCYKA